MISDAYKEFLQNKHKHDIAKNRRWGSSGLRYSGEWVRWVMDKYPDIQTVLDFGAGHGTLSEIGGAEWTNYDPCMPGMDVLPKGQFDLVVSTDCLEHVEPDLLSDTIREIGALSRRYIALDIPNEGTGTKFDTGPYKGCDEHLTVEAPMWWAGWCGAILDDFVLRKFNDRKVLLKGRKRQRVKLLYERDIHPDDTSLRV